MKASRRAVQGYRQPTSQPQDIHQLDLTEAERARLTADNTPMRSLQHHVRAQLPTSLGSRGSCRLCAATTLRTHPRRRETPRPRAARLSAGAFNNAHQGPTGGGRGSIRRCSTVMLLDESGAEGPVNLLSHVNRVQGVRGVWASVQSV